jgi:hypothetical protein
MIDSNGNGTATSIPKAPIRAATSGAVPSRIARSSAEIASVIRAHPYLVAAGIVAGLGLALTGGLLARSRRRPSLSDIVAGWF